MTAAAPTAFDRDLPGNGAHHDKLIRCSVDVGKSVSAKFNIFPTWEPYEPKLYKNLANINDVCPNAGNDLLIEA